MNIPQMMPQQQIITNHTDNTGHTRYWILKIAGKPHVKCRDCDKMIWL